MLIKCDRITAADLEVWNDLEEIDDINSVKITQEKIDKAVEIISETCKEKSYVSVSWGKDSVVVLHLAYLSKIEIPAVWIKEKPMHNQYCETVRDLFLKEFPFQYHEIVADYSTVGFEPFLDQNGDSILFHSIAHAVNISFGRRITGIRIEESGRRKIRHMTYGYISKNTSAPISTWRTVDVFAYLKKFNLPIHPNYAMLGGGRYDRNHIRVDCLGGTQGGGFGRYEWEREYYQDVLNRINYNP
jgi:phosphoadenosine phosphosulfate reductase